jgi:1-acyl-sn-glycerol-3-phosphate acyltransferase
MKVYFPEDSYDTPSDTRRAVGDRLALGTRLYFSYLLARIVLDCRARAARGAYDEADWAESSHRNLVDLERCGARFHIRGIDAIRRAKPPVVFVGNHMSTLETFVLPSIIAPILRVTFVVKESLVKHPFFGPIMRSRDPVIVGRKNPRDDLEAVLTGGAERLARGISMVVFPQATRSDVFERGQFNSLGVKLARRAGVPVVPVAIRSDFWANGKILKELGPLRRDRPVHMAFGDALAVRGNGAEQHELVVRFIETHLAAWGVCAGAASDSGTGRSHG